MAHPGWSRGGPSGVGGGAAGGPRRGPSGGAAGAAAGSSSGGNIPMGSGMFWKPGTTFPGDADRDVETTGAPAVYNPHEALPILKQRALLPAYQKRTEILYALERYRTVVLVGETGSGKSTQIPQYLHESGWTTGGKIVGCTQPRRVAAATVAARVADEMGVTLGAEVGYAVRFDDCTDPSRTVIKFMTDGVLVREIMMDPLLTQYSCIMLDEAHERSLQSDMLLGLMKKIQKKRPELRLIVSSATLDAYKFKNFFEANETGNAAQDTACIVAIQGRQHPVDILYLEQPVADYVRASVETIVSIHQKEHSGDILCFLPGQEEIEKACDMVQDQITEGNRPAVVYPLYANLTWQAQLKAMSPAPLDKQGRPIRKVVIATNIAETSLTMDGVVYVVDSGFVKIPVYDPISGLDSLVVQPVSKASANQRAGRAGRQRAGKCFRLYPETTFEKLIPETPPEMCRVRLDSAVVQLKALGIDDVAHFEFIDAPPAESMIRALELLFALGALNEHCKLTHPIGRQLAEFPAEPCLSAMLLASLKMGCAEEALTIAAMTSVQSIHTSMIGNAKADEALSKYAALEGDHLTLINIYNAFLDNNKSTSWCGENGFKFRTLSRAVELRRHLRRYLEAVCGPEDAIVSADEDDATVRKCVVAGFFMNAARLRPDGAYQTVKDGRRVELHPTSVLYRFGKAPDWIVYHDVVLTSSEYVREASAINPLWLTELAPHYYQVSGIGSGKPAKRKEPQSDLDMGAGGILALLAGESAQSSKQRRTLL